MPRPPRPQPNSPARLPQSPRHAGQNASEPTKGKEELANVRSAANFKIVQRNDPALAEILDTTAYAVIYHWGDGKWEKQKQEGSLFVIRRTKAPEYALFMLNRQAVKNVTIPLVPGEMKATVIDASMLQVARRGEKIRYGIWFTDANDVPRFRETIVRICGEPVKPPPGAAPSAASASTSVPLIAPNSNAPRSPATAVAPFHPPNHAVAPFKPQQEDGLSRLFAGLTTVPAGSSGGPSPQPASPLPADPAIYNATPTRTSPGASQPQQQQSQSSQSQQKQTRTPPPPANFAPGQTVDDLLRGILGQPSQPSPQPPRQQQPPAPAQQFTSPPPSGPGPFPRPPMGSANGAPNGFFGPGPGPIPPPVVARDAIADSLPPPPGGPADRSQMKEMITALMHEDRFIDDVWRAYCARTGRPI